MYYYWEDDGKEYEDLQRKLEFAPVVPALHPVPERSSFFTSTRRQYVLNVHSCTFESNPLSLSFEYLILRRKSLHEMKGGIWSRYQSHRGLLFVGEKINVQKLKIVNSFFPNLCYWLVSS